jgi:hypothetical protein
MARTVVTKLTVIAILALLALASAQGASAGALPRTKEGLGAWFARIQQPAGISERACETRGTGGWGAAATYAKQKAPAQTITAASTASAALLTPAQLAKYGWGAAGTYAKQAAHGVRTTRESLGQRAGLTNDELSRYGWGAAATYAKAMKRHVGSR